MGEICDAIVAIIDDPEISLQRLMEIVPGPDFPTGGIIMGRRGIADAYATGRGRIVVRGRVHRETVGGREPIVIDEIPYQVNQATLIEKIVDASKNDRIPDIADIRNHSGRDARTRIEVVLKKGADPDVVENQLYEFTPLQSTFSVANIALVHRQPRDAQPPPAHPVLHRPPRRGDPPAHRVPAARRPSSRPTGWRA